MEKKKMKKILVCFVAFLSSFAFAQDEELPWNDTHSIIASDKLLNAGIDTKEALIDLAVRDFPRLWNYGYVSKDLCKLFYIEDRVDFINYLNGFYDQDYSDLNTSQERVFRENSADKLFNQSWQNIVGFMAMGMNKSDCVDLIQDEARVLFSFDVVRDCSPNLRLTLAQKRQIISNFINS